MISTLKTAAVSCVALLPLTALPAVAQEVIPITIGAGLPPHSNSVAKVIDYVIPEIDRRLAESGNYKIEWTTGWSGTIAGQFDMFEAVQDGIIDIGSVNTLFEGAKLPMEQITYVTPFGGKDLPKAMEIFAKLRAEMPEIDEQFLRYNQRRLGVGGLVDYHLLSKLEIKTLDDLQGKKFGTPGLAANWLDGTGATPVAGSLSEYYNSLKTGVYDGIVMFESGIAPFKFHEVAPIITRVGFGSQLTTNLTINEDKWQSLPKEVQDILVDVAAGYETKATEGTVALAKKSLETAVAEGATINDMEAGEIEKLAAALPNIALVWAKSIDDKDLPGTKMLQRYMELSREAGINFARDWDKE